MQSFRQPMFFLILSAVVLFFYPFHAMATDTKTLASQIDKDLRQAERLMFNGKKTESDALLQQVNEMLEQLKAVDSSSKVTSLENKYSRTRKALDKKMGGGTTAPAISVAPKMSAPAAPAVKGVSPSGSSRKGGYQQQMMERNIKKAVKDVDYEIGRAREMMEPDNTNSKFGMGADEKAAKGADYLAKAEQHLAKTEQKYPDLSPESKEQFAVARKSIAETQAALDSWQKEEQIKTDSAAREAAVTANAAAGKMAKMKDDADLIVALHEKYFNAFENIHGGTLVHGMKIEEADQALALVANAEKSIPLFATDVGRLAQSYGETSMDIYNKFHEGGYTLNNGEDQKMSQLIEAVDKLKKSRQASAVTLAGNAKVLLGAFSDQLNDARLQRMAEAKKLLLAGQQFDPENDQIKQMLNDIDSQMEQVADKMTAQIDAAKWAGNISGFAGPGDVTELAAEAKKYFENDRDWGGKKDRDIKILDVCIRGPWKVAETDVFGRVISWRLPIHVAVTDEKLKPRNLARVYDLSILAMEGPADNAPKNPPYDGFWVGDSWMMRLDKF